MSKHIEKECFVKEGIKRGAGWCEVSCPVTNAFRFGVALVKFSVAFDGFAPLWQKRVLFFLKNAAKSGGTAEKFSSL